MYYDISNLLRRQ